MRSALATSALIMATLSLGFAAPAAALTRLVDDGLVPCVGGGLPIHDTIGAAVVAAAPGEAIGVCPGTYPESVTINKAGLVLQAVGLVKVVNPGAAVNGLIVNANNVTVQGLDVSGFTAFDGCAIVAARADGDVRNNKVHDNTFGICIQFADGTRVRNNLVENNGQDAVFASAFDSAEVFSNTLRNNGGYGIRVLNCDRPLGVVPTEVHHNSVIGNGSDGINADACPAIIANNTLRDNASGPTFHGIHVVDSENAAVTRNNVRTSNIGILVDQAVGTAVSFNSVTFNTVGIDLVDADAATVNRNNVSRNTLVDCRWDQLGFNTFTANSCGTEIPAGAWD